MLILLLLTGGWLFAVLACKVGAEESEETVRPPLTPRWADEPWAWEETGHTSEAVRELVDGYQANGIPLGAVIIDSPWETNYNTFEFGPNYPDPAGLIQDLHGRGVRVLLWATCFLNVSSTDGPEQGKAPLYDEAYAAGYLVNGGQLYRWHHGQGSAIDFFNPAAVAWWYAQMDRAFALGIDGWKVDNSEIYLWNTDDPQVEPPDEIETADGPKTRKEYSAAYYRAFYRYTVERNPEAIITARPYDGGRVYAPVDANPAGWVGDQGSEGKGIDKALDNIVESAKRGYVVVGSDIGGHGRLFPKVFLRWIQLGAFSPLMENGGPGEHRPWKLGPEVLASYRSYAKLHHELVPYLYSAGVEAHLTGRPILRDARREARQYLLGDDFLVAPIVIPGNERDVTLPENSRWYDYWDDERVIDGPAVVQHQAPRDRIPLFIRAGAIVPLQVEDSENGHGDLGSRGRLTLLMYPDGESERVYHPDGERAVLLRSRREGRQTNLEFGAQTERYAVRIKETGPPDAVTLRRGSAETLLAELPDWAAFDGAEEGWYFDPLRHHLWIRLATQETDARLSYVTTT